MRWEEVEGEVDKTGGLWVLVVKHCQLVDGINLITLLWASGEVACLRRAIISSGPFSLQARTQSPTEALQPEPDREGHLLHAEVVVVPGVRVSGLVEESAGLSSNGTVRRP
jgi:hypothetical protein